MIVEDLLRGAALGDGGPAERDEEQAPQG